MCSCAGFLPWAFSVLRFVEGTTFLRAWSRSVIGEYGQVETRFASLDDLIEMKEAPGRPQDMEDLRVLLELKEERAESPDWPVHRLRRCGKRLARKGKKACCAEGFRKRTLAKAWHAAWR